jgi:hypothetical protein
MDRRLSGADRARRREFDETSMTLITVIENDEGEEAAYYFPAKFEVCTTCDGKGKHVNPSIDSHGITSDEWQNDWSPEEQEAYMGGAYDVSCYECKGARVVPAVDEDKCNEEMKAALVRWNKQQEERAAYDAQCRKELEMGY